MKATLLSVAAMLFTACFVATDEPALDEAATSEGQQQLTTCGDGFCHSNETYENCPLDCILGCGDMLCDPMEYGNCWDCGQCPPSNPQCW